TTPPALSKGQVLTNVFTLATQFSACVEAFNLIHPSKDSDRHQKVALAKLGLQQGRLLIFGDAVGIYSPPATIARRMIPSHPGATNPEPHLPINFGVRDPRLDEPAINKKVRAALEEISGRPLHMSREQLMDKYGLKSPKKFSSLEYPALDTNRLEGFREKFGLLQDLVRQTGVRAPMNRGMSMTMQRWTVKDVFKFNDFVRTVRIEVDGLIALMGLKERVDRGMRLDIKAFGWHPEFSGPIVRQDWDKLKLIQEACMQDYPEYVEVTQVALRYLSEELKGTNLANMRTRFPPPTASTPLTPTSPTRRISGEGAQTTEKEKMPGFMSRLKSWKGNTGKQQPLERDRSRSIAVPNEPEDPQRSLSEDLRKQSKQSTGSDTNGLTPTRSKSLSAVSADMAPFDLSTRLQGVSTRDTTPTNTTPTKDTKIHDTVDPLDIASTRETGIDNDVDPLDTTIDPLDTSNNLSLANTQNSLIDRHDMYKGIGRIETKDIREKSH
ncbi:hypothetical protein K504DRAFT_344761, partial [Pleomassaria siparia CBS 279.74]